MPLPGGFVEEGRGVGVGVVVEGLGVGVVGGLVDEEDTIDMMEELDGAGVGVGVAERTGTPGGGSSRASTQYDFPDVKPTQLGPMVGF